MKKVLLFMADGTEECEALITVDLLRRADIDVTTVSVMNTNILNTSSGIKIEADKLINEIDFNMADMLVLPGGMPGTKYLGDNTELRKALIDFYEQNKPIAAICAAPSVLGQLGLLEGKKAICYPGFEEALTGATISDVDPVTDANITTASGLGHAIPFALELIKVLKGEKTSKEVSDQIGY